MLLLQKNNRITIHQFVREITIGDATSNEMRFIQSILKRNGYRSDIFAWKIDSRIKNIYYYKKYKPNKNDILIYHLTGKDDLVLPFLKKFLNRKILIYHNITPSHFFSGYSNKFVRDLTEGRECLQKSSKMFDLAFGDSKFNAQELRSMNFKNVRTLPIIYDFERLDNLQEDRVLSAKLKNEYITNIVFIGRIAPNKKQDDLIKTFYLYNKYVNAFSRLFLVGADFIVPRYVNEIKNLIKILELDSLVTITGHITDREWITYYKNADLFVSMSEHEGFFVPALECMHLKIPMLLYKSTAVPDTASNTAVYFDKKNFEVVAEMMDLVLKKDVKTRLFENSKKRLKNFQKDKISKFFLSEINKFINK
ncbi:glycosyltransferase [Candidatus Dojkabacteria bacterium]|nr:glycosyltransferase [Candidatus Dojkabacteria bacterium]